jgi:alpha-beta hydrolase superfamily lysophospholipase
MSLLAQVVGFLAGGYFIILGVMYWKQESFLFYPTATSHAEYKATNVKDYSFSRDGVTVKGWLVNPLYAREKIVIYYGGNGEDVFFNIDEFEALQVATLFVAYRGYGPSEGVPGEEDLFVDALGIFDDIRIQYPSSRIFLMGRSLGSGVACYVGSKRQVAGAILITPYDSLVSVAQSAYPWLPVGRLLRHRFDSVAYVAKVEAPFLIFYGGRDTVVRPERTRKLIDHIRGEKKVVYIERGEHGTISMFPEYWPSVLEFLNDSGAEAGALL